jgi:hypothetical protein
MWRWSSVLSGCIPRGQDTILPHIQLCTNLNATPTTLAVCYDFTSMELQLILAYYYSHTFSNWPKVSNCKFTTFLSPLNSCKIYLNLLLTARPEIKTCLNIWWQFDETEAIFKATWHSLPSSSSALYGVPYSILQQKFQRYWEWFGLFSKETSKMCPFKCHSIPNLHLPNQSHIHRSSLYPIQVLHICITINSSSPT